MQILYQRCCGVDVHKRSLTACLRVGDELEKREVSTTTQALREFAEWLESKGCEMVAIESTGSYWKPVYNCLELLGLDVMIVNAQHMRAVPGRKTDAKDAEWLSDLLQHGLLRASYIPDKAQRELREITRYRKSLVEERAREKNRLEKVFEGANIKLSSFVSDLSEGRTSKALIQGILQGGVDESNIDGMLFGSLKGKREELLKACDGFLTTAQRFLVLNILDHIEDMGKRIESLDQFIDTEMQQVEQALQALDEIPGIGMESAQVILAEIGTDMSRFPSAAHLASWAGLSPGNHESAGKRKTGRTCKGNKTLKTTLVQCAQSAIRVKTTFFKAQFDRLRPQRGRNRAVVAVAHSMIIAIYHMLRSGEPFHDLGVDYYQQFDREKKINYHLRKAAALGWEPTPVPA